MPAPDMTPRPRGVSTRHAGHARAGNGRDRRGPGDVAVHLLPRLVEPARLAGVDGSGGVVVMIDQLRASTTIAAALANGARAVVPTLTVDDARRAAAELRAAGEAVLLGGERGGLKIEGFDLDNSPRGYARERVAGRIIVFTTTNGTAALLHAGGAAGSGPVRVLVGALANLSAIAGLLRDEWRPVHILCAGTRDEVSMDDALAAGALVDRLVAAGRTPVDDDAARLCLEAWRGAVARGGGPGRATRLSISRRVELALRDSFGGRNLVGLGLDADVAACSVIDAWPSVPEWHPAARLGGLGGAGPGGPASGGAGRIVPAGL